MWHKGVVIIMKKCCKTVVSIMSMLLIAIAGVLSVSAEWAKVEDFTSWDVGDAKNCYTWCDNGTEVKISIVEYQNKKAYKIELVKGSGWIVAGIPISKDKNNWTNADTLEFTIDTTNFKKGSNSDTGTGYSINLVDGKGERFDPNSSSFPYQIDEGGVMNSFPSSGEVWLDDGRNYVGKVRVKFADFVSSAYQDNAGVATRTMQMDGFREFRVGFTANGAKPGAYLIISELRVSGNNLNIAAGNTQTPESSAPESSAPESSAPESSAPESSASSQGGDSEGFPVWAIILIIVIVLAGAGTAAYFLVVKKRKSNS